jgi:predicted nucleic acid-binding protein
MTNFPVSNSTVLIALESIGRMDLLPKLYGKVLITAEVRKEVFDVRGMPVPEWVKVEQVEQGAVKEIEQLTGLKLDRGEAEALALAHRLQTILLIDDLRGRKAAERLLGKHRVMGTLKLLLEAKRKGILRQVKPLLVALEQTGRYLDEQLRRWVLEEAEEVSCDGGACLFGAGCRDAKCQGASH